MVYHSSIDAEGFAQACGCPMLPLRTAIRGPAPTAEADKEDIIDEAIAFFRANVLFRKYEVKSAADKLLLYLTLYISLCLKKLELCRNTAGGANALNALGQEKFALPGEAGFPLQAIFAAPQTRDEAELFRLYLKQARDETSSRLMERCFSEDGTANKWWLAFSKRKFMNIALQT